MKRSSSWGFTLIELLLVLVIMGIIAAVTVPSVARSMRGNRLRSAARTVVMAGRYARSMAVLHQHEMKVSFDLARGIVWITPYDPPHPLDDDDTDATNGDDPVDEAPPPAWEAVDVPEEMELADGARPLGPRGPKVVRRELDRVTIERVLLETEDFMEPEITTRDIIYRSDGTCDAYRVVLLDEVGDALTIDVDPLSSASTSEGSP